MSQMTHLGFSVYIVLSPHGSSFATNISGVTRVELGSTKNH